MTSDIPDVVDLLAGIEPGSPLDAIRSLRPQARENAERSFVALFHPADPSDATVIERLAVAHFVAGLHESERLAAFYAERLLRTGGDRALAQAVDSLVAAGAAKGPYGTYPQPGLAGESVAGPDFTVPVEQRDVLGARLAAAFEHAHMLVFHPRDAAPVALQRLVDAGWSTAGIVTLSQLVSFLAFQIRLVEGLRTLASAR